MSKSEVQTTEDAVAQGKADAAKNAKAEAKVNKPVKGVDLDKNLEEARKTGLANADADENAVDPEEIVPEDVTATDEEESEDKTEDDSSDEEESTSDSSADKS